MLCHSESWQCSRLPWKAKAVIVSPRQQVAVAESVVVVVVVLVVVVDLELANGDR